METGTLELTNQNRDAFGQEITTCTTASQWFIRHFPDQAKQWGAPFLETNKTSIDGFTLSSPIAPNLDFMAACLGGDQRLGHSVIYWPGECQFYYYEPFEKLYYPTQDSKLGDLMRGYFSRCALEMQRDVNVYHLFTTFRTDQVIKPIIERAKSILRASEDFFSATSPYTRVRGVELHERLARVFVEKMLVAKTDELMLVAPAFDKFAQLIKERDLFPIKRSQFQELIAPLIREKFNSGLRNDLVVEGRYQRGWKDICLNAEVVLE